MFVGFHPVVIAVCLDHAGREIVERDAVRGILPGQVEAERGLRILERGIDQHLRIGHAFLHAPDGEHPAPFARGHPRHDQLHQFQRGPVVDRHLAVEIGGGDGGPFLGQLDGGVENENIDLAQSRLGGGDQCARAGGEFEVALDERGFGPERRRAREDFGRVAVGTGAMDRDRGAGFRKSQGDGGANAARGTGHKGGAAPERERGGQGHGKMGGRVRGARTGPGVRAARAACWVSLRARS